jgi:hypothetical protein
MGNADDRSSVAGFQYILPNLGSEVVANQISRVKKDGAITHGFTQKNDGAGV